MGEWNARDAIEESAEEQKKTFVARGKNKLLQGFPYYTSVEVFCLDPSSRAMQ